MELTPLGPSDVDVIAALCRRSLADPPQPDELAACLFAPDQPATVRGQPDIGVVATVASTDPAAGEGFVRLIAVDPAHRGQGAGRALLAAAEADLAGKSVITVGADAPYYLYPGAPASETALLCLLERAHYQRQEANFNMDVDLGRLPRDPGGTALATEEDRDEVAAWMAANWANWRAEVLRALDKGTLLLSRDREGVVGFCAWDVNRRGLLGPIAVRLDVIGKGAGVPLLLGGLHRMRQGGRSRAQVAWVGPIVPYARVGGVVGQVFFVYRKRLR
jgi:GNAT superfamily N-acetyltransferase